MKSEHFRINRSNNSCNDCLHVFVMKPNNTGENKIIIFVHGFLGEGVENHRMFFRMGETLSKNGFTCILFDQYGCGYSDGEYKDVRLNDLFEDIRTVFFWVKKNYNGLVGFLGQSVGSAIVLTNLYYLKPDFAIVLNPAANFDSWLENRYDWDLSKNYPYYYAYPKGIMVSQNFINDLMLWNWIESLNVIDLPVLIIASTDDDIDSVKSAYSIKEKMNETPEIICIKGANHSFIGQKHLENKATDSILKWLYKTLE